MASVGTDGRLSNRTPGDNVWSFPADISGRRSTSLASGMFATTPSTLVMETASRIAPALVFSTSPRMVADLGPVRAGWSMIEAALVASI